ncbi:DUF1444 domain-containing protein [Bacillus sp. B1-b2]|uniref:DUF1444 domain-containing protein n=1 Tax=Bacillus sp. B1-b2 TaxID=2653201 RepID=UPI0012615205|nr:DUF1444 domain-containing protein [Bacillus sp. B1-b2]KAB7666834.1 DUF1444 domain-containing protein [Bacillus sp. B1-b2]
MDSKQMKDILVKRLSNEDRSFTFDKKKDQLRIESKQTKKGVTITLPGIIARWENEKEKAIDEMVYYIEEGLKAIDKDCSIEAESNKIYPVIRSTSFPIASNEEIPFITEDHTAETRIYFALDLGNTYRLIDEKIMQQENWTPQIIKEMALFNVRSLSTSMKKDSVAGNTFYFLNSNDGYDASRVLNDNFLKNMNESLEGTMAVAVPHQDVLIIADVVNETGYDILAQMTMSFFASGRVPITALSFLYEEGQLEPIFILGKNKKREK